MAVKKTVAKKEATTAKPAEKKVAAPKKTAAPKKAAAPKKTTAEKVAKMTVNDYEDKIRWKKGEAHAINQNIEISAKDLLTEFEAGVNNLKTVCEAMLNCMLEGDEFLVEPKGKTKVSEALTVRYYCDNLSETRRKYFE